MTLFPLDPAPPAMPGRHRDMIAMYGDVPDKTCRTCAHLRRYHRGSTWMKCIKANPTASAATDWRAGWTACGLYVEVQK